MKTYNEIQMIPLEEVLQNLEIFALMSDISFIPDESVAEYMDLEYFLNRSGRKIASPLVMRLSDENGFEVKLANIITNRYKPKWEQLFARYSGLSTLNLLNNINVKQDTKYGKKTQTDADNSVSKVGTETNTLKGTETRSESYGTGQNVYTSDREISGKYTDSGTDSTTRSGNQDITETYGSGGNVRKSTKKTTGGYSDTDSTASTRTGSQIVTDKGDTLSATFGFNSTDAVPTTRVGPADSTIGATQETTYGANGLVDTRSGAITRAYNPETGLQEETIESGERKTSTTYGQDGLKDEGESETTREYHNYHDKTTMSGSKSLSIDFGQDGRTNELSFNDRSDDTHIDETVTLSGIDTVEEVGYRYRRDELLQQYLALFQNANIIDFLEIVYQDVDNVLTLPVFA